MEVNILIDPDDSQNLSKMDDAESSLYFFN